MFVELGDVMGEGVTRTNIALTLCQLNRYADARVEILRAIACICQVGHAARPWTAFRILHQIETAAGDQTAAHGAWQQARDAYLAYRQQGGYAQYSGGQLVEVVLDMMTKQSLDEIAEELRQLVQKPDTADSRKLFLSAIITILNGSRDPTLADDPTLEYDEAAELLFLLKRLEN